jgi:hypothetical protein
VAREALNVLREFKSEIERGHWLKRLAEIVGVEEKILLDVLRNVRSKKTFGKNSLPGEKPQDAVKKNRKETIIEQLAGLLLVDSELWEETYGEVKTREWLSENQLLSMVFEKGAEAKFSFEAFLTSLEEEKTKDLFQNIFFQTKYRPGDKGGIVEIELDGNKKSFEDCLEALKKEELKDKLQMLAHDIKKAESEGDGQAKDGLIKEFGKVSQELK